MLSQVLVMHSLSSEVLNHLKINYLRSRQNSKEGVLGPGDMGLCRLATVLVMRAERHFCWYARAAGCCGSPKKDRTRNLSGEILNHLKINYLRSRQNSSEGILCQGDFGVMSFGDGLVMRRTAFLLVCPGGGLLRLVQNRLFPKYPSGRLAV